MHEACETNVKVRVQGMQKTNFNAEKSLNGTSSKKILHKLLCLNNRGERMEIIKSWNFFLLAETETSIFQEEMKKMFRD